MVALLLLAAAPARAGYDRAAIEAGFCGGGAAEAGQRVLAGLAGAERDDLAWARGFVVAAQERKVPCPAGASPLLNLRSRATYEFAAALLNLLAAPTPEARAAALPVLGRRVEAIPAGLLDRAAKAEADPDVRAGIEELLVTADIDAPDIARRIVAVQRLAANPTTRAATRLDALRADPAYAADAGFRTAVDAAIATVRRGVFLGQVLTVLYNGLSFGSILFMSAVGLAVICGLMGVINLAQGEFIMLGAYVTWLVQQAVRTLAPGLLEWVLPIAILPAFLVTA